MATNDFKAFATAVGANVLTQAEYEALAARLSGFQAGTAKSAEINKAIRQASVIAYVVAQMIVDQTGSDALDDGTTSALLANLKSAVRSLGSSQPASTTAPGIIEIATNAEAIAGTDSARAIVPSALAAVIANLALGTMSKQSAGAVAITGGSISGIADLAIADGGTGASTAAQALANLGGAPLASPALTGTPTAPTAAVGTNNTQIANTAFVQAAVAALVAAAPTTLDTLNELAAALGDDPNFATTITNALALKAPLASPALTGNPTAPTPASGDNDTSIATTAFVQLTANGILSKSVAGGANVTLTAAEAGYATIKLTGALTANIAVIVPAAAARWTIWNATSGAYTVTVKTSAGTGVIVTQGTTWQLLCDGTNVVDANSDFKDVALTGAPTAPTAAVGTNTTQLATTAFTKAQIAADVPTTLAGQAVGAVGSRALLRLATPAVKNPGDVVAGSSLRYSSCDDGFSSSTAPSGTWMCCGYTSSANGYGQSATEFLRIS